MMHTDPREGEVRAANEIFTLLPRGNGLAVIIDALASRNGVSDKSRSELSSRIRELLHQLHLIAFVVSAAATTRRPLAASPGTAAPIDEARWAATHGRGRSGTPMCDHLDALVAVDNECWRRRALDARQCVGRPARSRMTSEMLVVSCHRVPGDHAPGGRASGCAIGGPAGCSATRAARTAVTR